MSGRKLVSLKNLTLEECDELLAIYRLTSLPGVVATKMPLAEWIDEDNVHIYLKNLFSTDEPSNYMDFCYLLRMGAEYMSDDGAVNKKEIDFCFKNMF